MLSHLILPEFTYYWHRLMFKLPREYDAEDIYNIYVGVSRFYDYIVVDAGGPLNDISVTLMDATDRILLVTTPDLALSARYQPFLSIKPVACVSSGQNPDDIK